MIDSLIVKHLQQIFMPKMHQNTFGGRAPPWPAVERKCSPRPTYCNRGGPTSKGSDISIDWLQDDTTLL